MNPVLLQLLAPLLALGCGVGAVLGLRDARRAAVRLRRATPARGTVTDVEFNSSQQALCTVGFTTADGHPVQARPESSSNLRSYHAGQPVNLWYDPEHPTWIVLEGQPSPAGVAAVVGAVLAVAAIALALVSVVALS